MFFVNFQFMANYSPKNTNDYPHFGLEFNHRLM